MSSHKYKAIIRRRVLQFIFISPFLVNVIEVNVKKGGLNIIMEPFHHFDHGSNFNLSSNHITSTAMNHQVHNRHMPQYPDFESVVAPSTPMNQVSHGGLRDPLHLEPTGERPISVNHVRHRVVPECRDLESTNVPFNSMNNQVNQRAIQDYRHLASSSEPSTSMNQVTHRAISEYRHLESFGEPPTSMNQGNRRGFSEYRNLESTSVLSTSMYNQINQGDVPDYRQFSSGSVPSTSMNQVSHRAVSEYWHLKSTGVSSAATNNQFNRRTMPNYQYSTSSSTSTNLMDSHVRNRAATDIQNFPSIGVPCHSINQQVRSRYVLKSDRFASGGGSSTWMNHHLNRRAIPESRHLSSKAEHFTYTQQINNDKIRPTLQSYQRSQPFRTVSSLTSGVPTLLTSLSQNSTYVSSQMTPTQRENTCVSQPHIPDPSILGINEKSNKPNSLFNVAESSVMRGNETSREPNNLYGPSTSSGFRGPSAQTKSLPRKKLTCNYCFKIFRDKSDLIRHTRVHTGEKPYVCSHCGKYFSRKFSLKRHLLMHENFSCEKCGEKFRWRKLFKNHVKRHHIS